MKPREYFAPFNKIEGLEQQFVNYHYENYTFILTRFEKMRINKNESPAFLFFIYILKKDKVVNKVDDFVCFNRVYHTYAEFMDNLLMIAGEYILDHKKYNKCIQLAEKLNPN